MSQPTFASLFSGGGLADCGAVAAGCVPIHAVEYNAAIAEVYRANHGPHVVVSRVEDADPMRCPERPTVLWASPSCVRASVANANAGESLLDIGAAHAVAHWIEVLEPPCVFIENVRGYAKFEAFGIIRAALDRAGYWSQAQVLDAADFGVPQNRKRLILRATRHDWLPPLPTPEPWRGWYEAIEDLLPELPESAFAPWQLARMGDAMPAEVFLHMTGATSSHPETRGTGIKMPSQPTNTVTASGAKDVRAFLVPGGNATSFSIRQADEPARTIGDVERVGNIPRAFIASGTNANRAIPSRDEAEPVFTITATDHQKGSARAWLNEGRVVKMSPRALARFQSVPDEYLLPPSNGLACKVLGNGVACTMAEKLIKAVLQ